MIADAPIPLDPVAFPLEGTRLIEASAGTGKTYTIASLYLRLVAERDLGVGQILVVTFTRAATEELRGRIRERLRDALEALGAEPLPTEDAVIAALRARAGLQAVPRLEAALTALDEAAVFTIHGFCHRVLTDNAFESGEGFDAELVNDDREYRLQAVRDFWRRRCYVLEPEPAGWVYGQWPGPEALLADLGDALRNPRLRLLPDGGCDYPAVRAELDSLRAEMAALWATGRDALIAELLQSKVLSHAAKAYSAQNLTAAAVAMDRWLALPGPAAALPEGFALFTDDGLADGRTDANKRKGTPAPGHRLFDVCGAMARLAARCRQGFLMQIRREALAFCRAETTRRKAQVRVLAPDDLLERTASALAGPGTERLAARVRAVWPVALIDEFQDTDPLQYHIFRTLYAARTDASLVMIGDPKQAIYSFRGADLFTYLQAARDVPGAGGRYGLDTNWRSSAALVDVLNGLFGSGHPFVLEGAIGYHPVRAQGRADASPLVVDGDAPGALRVWHVRATDENLHQGRIPGTWSRAAVPAGMAAEIARLLALGQAGRARVGDRPLTARDLAVLVRDRHQARAVQEALRALGVGSAFITRESVLEGADAVWLTDVLEAVAADGDERTLRRALAGPILGWDAPRLEALNRDEGLLDAVQGRFRDYAGHWRSQGLMPMLDRLLHGEGVPARLLALADGERRLTDLRHLGELLQNAEREVPGGPEGLLRWYRDTLGRDGAESEEAQLRLESDENLVQVVTVHKSKGLQYPVVFLPFPWTSKPYTEKSERLLFHHPDDGVPTLDLGSDAFAEHVAPADRERLAEDMRLLYVALTRAQHRVYCTWGRFRGAEHSAMARLLHGEPTALDDGLIESRLAGLAAAHPGGLALVDLAAVPRRGIPSRDGPAAGAGVRRVRRRLVDDWGVTSYSALASGAASAPERPDFDAQDRSPELPPPEHPPEVALVRPSGVFAFPRGVRAGQCLHGILEEIDFRGTDTDLLAAVAERHLRRQGLDPVWRDTLTEWIERILATPLDAESGLSLGVVPAERRMVEMGFFLPLARLHPGALDRLLARWRGTPSPGPGFHALQGMLSGFIDLVVEHRGRFYVIDYKSNHLGNSHADYVPARLQEAVRAHHYDLQYLIYSLAIHRYLARRLPDYAFERHFGGVYYLFLRGMGPDRPGIGVHRVRPPLDLIDALDELFRGQGVAA